MELSNVFDFVSISQWFGKVGEFITIIARFATVNFGTFLNFFTSSDNYFEMTNLYNGVHFFVYSPATEIFVTGNNNFFTDLLSKVFQLPLTLIFQPLLAFSNSSGLSVLPTWLAVAILVPTFFLFVKLVTFLVGLIKAFLLSS